MIEHIDLNKRRRFQEKYHATGIHFPFYSNNGMMWNIASTYVAF